STALTFIGLPWALSTLTTAGASGPLGEAGRFLPFSGERRRRPADLAGNLTAPRRRRPRPPDAAAGRTGHSTPRREPSRMRKNSALSELISDWISGRRFNELAIVMTL